MFNKIKQIVIARRPQADAAIQGHLEKHWIATRPADAGNDEAFSILPDISPIEQKFDHPRSPWGRGLLTAAFILLLNIAPARAQDITSGLVGHWTFNESTGTIAYDSAGSANGTMQGGLSAANDSAPGKLGASLRMDGVNDGISLGNIAALNFDGVKPFTLAAWVNLHSNGQGGNIIGKYGGGAASNNQYSMYVYTNNTPTCLREAAPVNVSGTTQMQLGTWYHIVCRYDGTNLSTWVNGVQEGSAALGSTYNNGTAVFIGANANAGDASRFLDGYIDEARIYNRALTPEDIAELAAATYPGKLRYNTTFRIPEFHDGTKWVGMGPARPTMSGLVGWWKLDEASGTFADSSGNGNSGTQSGGVNYASAGVIGNAAGLDNIDDYIDIGNSASLNITGELTLSAWVNINALTDSNTIITKGDGFAAPNRTAYSFYLTADGRIGFAFCDGANASCASGYEAQESSGPHVPPSTILSNGSWFHVAVTYNDAQNTIKIYSNGVEQATNPNGGDALNSSLVTNSDSLRIGFAYVGQTLNGSIDDVRIYNRALSPNEITDLYIYGLHDDGLVAQWNFDEGAGGVVSPAVGDVIGYTSGAVTFSSAGQFGMAAEFHSGGDSAINMGDNFDFGSTSFTMCAWVKPFGPATNRGYVFGKYIPTPTNNGFWLRIDTSGTDRWLTGITSAQQIFADNEVEWGVWQHMCSVIQQAPSTSTLYKNAAALASRTDVPAAADNAVDFTIGNRYDNQRPFEGLIDDVRIYERALTLPEIDRIYQNGLAGHPRPYCTNPERGEGTIVFNGDDNVLQYCDGANWRAMGPVPGPGGGGCTDPVGAIGAVVYNQTHKKMQYCDGANWIVTGSVTYRAPTTGLLSYWKLDEPAGTTTASDSKGSVSGTLAAGVSFGNDGGRMGGAASFPGLNGQNIDLVDTYDFLGTANYTLSAWVNVRSHPESYGDIISKFNTPGGTTAWWLTVGATNGFGCGRHISGLGSVVKYMGSAITLDQWYHVACTYNGSEFRLYVNGTQHGAAVADARAMIDTPARISLGAHSTNGGAPNVSEFDGLIDEARIYGRALSAAEVLELYLATGGLE